MNLKSSSIKHKSLIIINIVLVGIIIGSLIYISDLKKALSESKVNKTELINSHNNLTVEKTSTQLIIAKLEGQLHELELKNLEKFKINKKDNIYSTMLELKNKSNSYKDSNYAIYLNKNNVIFESINDDNIYIIDKEQISDIKIMKESEIINNNKEDLDKNIFENVFGEIDKDDIDITDKTDIRQYCVLIYKNDNKDYKSIVVKSSFQSEKMATDELNEFKNKIKEIYDI